MAVDTDSTSPAAKKEVRVHSIQWRTADLVRIEEAARALEAREHISVSMTDVIRRGAIREAEVILSEASAS